MQGRLGPQGGLGAGVGVQEWVLGYRRGLGA